MKQKLNFSVFMFFCLLFTGSSYAQQAYTTLSGTFDQNKNYEITIAGKNADRPFRVLKAIVEPNSNKYLVRFPVQAGTDYSVRVDRLKDGHRRLELDQSVTLPLQLTGSQNLELNIASALFDQEKKQTLPKAKVVKKQPKATLVAGVISNAKVGAELSFEKVVNGQTVTMQTRYVPVGDSVFNFAVAIEKEGLYYLSTIRSKKAIYLHPGDDIAINLDLSAGTEDGASKTTNENKLIAQWEQIKLPLVKLVMQQKPDREVFTQLYQATQPQVALFLQQIKSGNAKFDALFSTVVQLDNNLLALQALLKSSLEKRGDYMMPAKQFLNIPDYYQDFLPKHQVFTSNLLEIGDAFTYLNLTARFSLVKLDDAKRKQLSDADKVRLYMDAVDNEVLKPLVLKSQLEDLEFVVANYSEFKETFLPFKQYAQSAVIQKNYDRILNMFVADTAFIGKSSYTFSLPDTTGKMVSMKDFKGKVVLIDTWATWCGPCKAQFPFLKELEAEYHGNDNIVFVGISIDAEKDKTKWKKAIKDYGLGAIQLLDDKSKSFGRPHGITAIPRFCLIDKEGNWAEIRCPLPEQKEKLKKYIDKLL